MYVSGVNVICALEIVSFASVGASIFSKFKHFLRIFFSIGLCISFGRKSSIDGFISIFDDDWTKIKSTINYNWSILLIYLFFVVAREENDSPVFSFFLEIPHSFYSSGPFILVIRSGWSNFFFKNVEASFLDCMLIVCPFFGVRCVYQMCVSCHACAFIGDFFLQDM